MAIESPATYAEWFWKNSVDATSLRAEQVEKTLAPIASIIINAFPDVEEMPPYITALFETFKSPPAPDLDNVLFKFVADLGSSLAQRVLGHEMKGFDQKVNAYLQNEVITPEIANTLMLRKKITPELWLARQQAGGFNEVEGTFIYESQKPYPSLPDIITYARYHGDPNAPKDVAWDMFDISPKDWPLWEFLSWQKLNTEQVMSLYKRKFWDEAQSIQELTRLGWRGTDINEVLNLSYSLPNPMLMIQGGLIQGYSKDAILEDVKAADIHPKYSLTYWDAVLTKPATQDLVAYELRRDPSLANLTNELTRIGVHPNYHALYKELAYQIPPVADIITMAVREAFTPAIAARFGQYEDLPEPYVEWVQKKGLSKEWAERYWAAHWSLPSPQQGFEMLHRGVIGEGDLNMLLRALDVMPFWRDKLTQIAYRPLSRVDVRRMYALGVIDVGGVRKAYTDLGYSDYNADLMTKFTIEYVKGVPKKLSTANIITAYQKHLIEIGTLRNLLSEAGIESEDIEPIIKTATKRREWSDTEKNIAAIEYQYKQDRYTQTEATTELSNLGLTSDYIQKLIPQWKVKSVTEKETLWTTAQTLSFIKTRLISVERGIKELQDLGYDEEHINIYIKATPTQKD